MNAQELLKKLVDAGYSVRQITGFLNGPSQRTVHRWLAGDSIPQRERDIDRLNRLVKGLTK